jgi:hypothetical protein
MFALTEYTMRNHGDTSGALIAFFFGISLLIIGLYYLIVFMKNNPTPKLEAINA